MLDLKIAKGDVLASQGDGLVIPIDGTLVPRDGQFERLLGNIGRQFLRRFPAAELVEQIEAQVDLPLPLGRATPVTLDEATWPHAVLVSTLHHVDELDQRARRALVRTSFLDSLRVSTSVGAQNLATAVLQGGWRLPAIDACAEMLRAAVEASGPATTIYVLEPVLHEQAQSLARSLGFREWPRLPCLAGNSMIFLMGLTRARFLLESNFGRRAGWLVELDGRVVAELGDVREEEMFWDSYAVTETDTYRSLPATSDRSLWEEMRFLFRNRGSGEVVAGAFAGARAPYVREGRILMRGLYLRPVGALESAAVRMLRLIAAGRKPERKGWRAGQHA